MPSPARLTCTSRTARLTNCKPSKQSLTCESALAMEKDYGLPAKPKAPMYNIVKMLSQDLLLLQIEYIEGNFAFIRPSHDRVRHRCPDLSKGCLRSFAVRFTSRIIRASMYRDTIMTHLLMLHSLLVIITTTNTRTELSVRCSTELTRDSIKIS